MDGRRSWATPPGFLHTRKQVHSGSGSASKRPFQARSRLHRSFQARPTSSLICKYGSCVRHPTDARPPHQLYEFYVFNTPRAQNTNGRTGTDRRTVSSRPLPRRRSRARCETQVTTTCLSHTRARALAEVAVCAVMPHAGGAGHRDSTRDRTDTAVGTSARTLSLHGLPSTWSGHMHARSTRKRYTMRIDLVGSQAWGSEL